MDLSVIIPVYNVEKYIIRCLKSLNIIDSEKVEIILVDDGSTDSSPEICNNYAENHSYVKVYHKENNGLSSARNFGIEHASGAYLCFIDSDDMVADSFIADMLRMIEQYAPDLIDFNYCEERTPDNFIYNGDKSVTQFSQKDFIDMLVKNKMGCQACFRIYRKNLFDDIKYPLGKYYEDALVFWKILLTTKNIIHVDYTYYIYNIVNTNSITKKVNAKSMLDMKQAFDEMYDGLKTFCIENNIDLDYLKYMKINGYVYIGYKTYKSKDDLNELNREIKKYICSNPVNIKKFCKSSYDWKKYLVLRIILLFSSY